MSATARWVPVLALAFACGAGACVKYVPAPLTPDATARAFALRTLADSGLAAALTTVAADTLPRWSPEYLALAAWYFRPEVESARRGWRTAQAAEVTAGQRPQPGVAVTGLRSEAGPFESPWGGILTLTIPVELGGKRGARVQAARSRSAVAELTARQVAWEVASDVRTAALTSIQRDSNTSAWARRVVLSQALEGHASRLYDAGGIGRSQVEGAAIAARLAAREYEVARAGAIGARAVLAQLVGVPAGAVEVRLDTGAEPGCSWLDGVSPDSLRALALTRRYDMGAALATYLVAEGELRVAVANQYPNLEIRPGLGWEQGLQRWILGLGLPELLLNRNRGPIGEAVARRAQVASEVEGVQQRILSEVEVAVAECRAAREARAAAATLVDAVAARERSVRAAFARGETGALEGLSLALAVAEAEAGLQRADLELVVIGSRLSRVAGLWGAATGDTLPDAMTWPSAVAATSGRSK
jgi:outer membrane protein TolC